MFEYYLSTNEFAKIVNVSKHTLFYYDKEGVFCPEKKDDNGFRYYSMFQIETFLVIKSLTEMGISLAGIKDYLQNRSAENCMTLLDEHQAILEAKIKRLQKITELIKEKQTTISEYFKYKPDQAYIAFEPQEILFITASSEDDYYRPFTEHLANVSEVALNLPCAVGHIIKNEDFANKTYFDYYFSKTDTEAASTLIKVAGNYLSYYHTKGYFTIDTAYEQLLTYAQQHQLELGDYFFEFMVLDELAVEGIENYVIKLSIAIKD